MVGGRSLAISISNQCRHSEDSNLQNLRSWLGTRLCTASWGALTRGAMERTEDSPSPLSHGDPQLPCLILKPRLWKMPAHRTVQSGGTWPAEGSCLRRLLLCSHFIHSNSQRPPTVAVLLVCFSLFHTVPQVEATGLLPDSPSFHTFAQDETPSTGMRRKKV